MRRKADVLKPKVFFNASVILAALNSPRGASGCLLRLVKKGRIEGVISELVWEEVVRHREKLGLSRRQVGQVRQGFWIVTAPERLKKKYERVAIDLGDVHLFTSAEEVGADYLVSLDKKHVLALKGKVREVKVVSPGELVELFKRRFKKG